MDSIKADQMLDCKGLNCPIPILRAAAAIRKLAPGQVLQVDATDPASVPDMAAWSRRTSNPLIGQSESGGVYSFLVRKSEGSWVPGALGT